MYRSPFVYTFNCQWIFGLFLPFGFVVNNAAMNMGIQYLFEILLLKLFSVHPELD